MEVTLVDQLQGLNLKCDVLCLFQKPVLALPLVSLDSPGMHVCV